MDVVSFCGSVSTTLLNEERYRGMASPLVMRVPTNRTGSEDYNDKGANLRIDMDQDQKKSTKAQMFSCECSLSLLASVLVGP